MFYRGKRGGEDIALSDAPEYLEFWKKLWEADGDYKAMARRELENFPTSGSATLPRTVSIPHRYAAGTIAVCKPFKILTLRDHNGEELKRVLLELAKIRGMDEGFVNWLTAANHFTNTLVDRIVPGYPRDTAKEICEETGFADNNIVKGGIFHLWVLQKEPFVQEKLPADRPGLNVVFADDITPYKQRKVKILNGLHTAMVPIPVHH